jgi:hypothetical protein
MTVFDLCATMHTAGMTVARSSSRVGLTRSYDRILRPGLAVVIPRRTPFDSPLRASFRQLEAAMT